MTSSSSSASSLIAVTLVNSEVFKTFYPFMEMLSREHAKPGAGKMIFPEFAFGITGLDDAKLYEISLSIERYDNLRYKYEKNQWISSDKKVEEVHEYKKMSKGVESGATWMKDPLTFPKARITNVKENPNPNTFYTAPLHKYQPVLHIQDVGTQEEWRFEVEQAQFLPTSKNYNEELRIWKKRNNPFSTHRNGGPGNPTNKRKAQDKPEEAPNAKRTPPKEQNCPALRPSAVPFSRTPLQEQPIPSFMAPTSHPSTSNYHAVHSNHYFNPQCHYQPTTGFGQDYPAPFVHNYGYQWPQAPFPSLTGYNNPGYFDYATASPIPYFPTPAGSPDTFFPPAQNENFHRFPTPPNYFQGFHF